MTSIIGGVNHAFSKGMVEIQQARQNGITDSFGMNIIAGYVNHLAARRMHVLAQGGNSVGNYPPSGLTIAGTFHTSPNCNRVEALMIAGRSTSATVLGSSRWSINSVFITPTVYTAGSVTGTVGPNDLSVSRTRMLNSGSDLVGNTTYSWGLETGATAISVLYFIIYEVPRDSLNLASDTGVPLDVFASGAPILDRDIGDVTDALWTLYKRQGIPQFTFEHVTGTTPTANATFKNVLDATTTGYASSAAGYWTIPYRKHRMTKTTLDVVLWAVSATLAGADGQVKFTNAAGTVGTITGISTAAVYTTTATIDASTSGSQLVVVEHKSAASTISTIAAGMYELI